MSQYTEAIRIVEESLKKVVQNPEYIPIGVAHLANATAALLLLVKMLELELSLLRKDTDG